MKLKIWIKKKMGKKIEKQIILNIQKNFLNGGKKIYKFDLFIMNNIFYLIDFILTKKLIYSQILLLNYYIF